MRCNNSNIFFSALFMIVAMLSGCGGGGSSSDGGSTPIPPVSLSSITITPASVSVAKGENTMLSATALYSDNTSANITSQVIWVSGNDAIATVASTSGIATGVAEGSTTVTASLSGITSASVNLSVTAAVVTGISITPTATAMPKGAPVTFTATGVYSDGTTGNISGSVNWFSSDATVATLNASGIAATLAQGSTNVTASAYGITSNNATLTVTAPALTAIAITPLTSSVATGLTTSFAATGTYTDGSTGDITNQVTWMSGNDAIATIASTSGIATGVAEGSTTVTASLNGITSTAANLRVTAAVITGISITPTATAMPKGTPVTFTATGVYSDGTTGNISGSVNWFSSDATVATLNASGIAATLAQGSTNVTASANGITSNSATLTVTAPALTAITITPLTSSVAIGLTTSFAATGTYTDGSTGFITNQTSWVSSNPQVAAISSSTGVATGVVVGNAVITATANGITSNGASLTVTTKVLTAIAVSPISPIANKGTPVTFTATGTYSDGTTGNISGAVTWSSSNATVATLSATGVATTLAQGSTNITASANGITSNSAALTVTTKALTSISITPVNVSVAKGLTTNFIATGTYTDGTTANITSLVAWASSNKGVATINSSTGVATGVAVGNTSISASQNGISSSAANLSVTAAVLTGLSISPTTPSTPAGTPVTFTATGAYSDGTTGNTSGAVAWHTSNAAIAILNSSGIASTLTQGSTTITASSNGITSNSATLTVTAKALASISISPANSSVATGLTTNFMALGIYTDGTTANITSQVAWSSSNTAAATINAAGVAAGKSAGKSTTITASLNGITSSTNLYVSSAVVTGIIISPTTPSTPKGKTVTFTATGKFSNGSIGGNYTGSVTWKSSNTTVATLNSSGVASTLGQGSSTITATYIGIPSNSATLTVTAPVLATFTVTPATVSVPVGNTQQFSASGTLTDGTAATLGSLTWTSSDATVATIDSTGLVTALKVGSTNISASSGGITAFSVLTTTKFASVAGGCVQDKVTGLIWEVKATVGLRNMNTVYSNFVPTSGTYGSSTDAAGYVSAVNSIKLCGYTDWRLPTMVEMQSIVDLTHKPTIDPIWFPNTPGGGPYWTSTPYNSGGSCGLYGCAMFVLFLDGSVISGGREGALYVRLVR